MEFDLDQRTASLSVGEFADFSTGPRDSGGGSGGIWRAQLGTHWHNELRQRTASEEPQASFEVPITGTLWHRGWTISLTGRIDQLVPRAGELVLREIKTVTRPLPAEEADLRASYPSYFAQLAVYAALLRVDTSAEIAGLPGHAAGQVVRPELVFVETASGLAQTIELTSADESFLVVQLERVAEFLDLRHRARERLRHLAFRPAFSTLRAGQETTREELRSAFERTPLVLFEAPTGFGKTGVLLEFLLTQLRSGHFDRALYLTSKSTGQLQVVHTLDRMTAPGPDLESGTAVAAWHVRNKGEHCVNDTFHCVRENCRFLERLEARWPGCGLARFYQLERHPRDLDTLREAGRHATICPYEITRTALAFNDVWVGDYNYVFAPANRTLFYGQPGFAPARTLLVIDEAHNLPSRVADAYSHVVLAEDARTVLSELDHVRAPRSLLRAWESWTQLLLALAPVESLDPALEADVADTLTRIADELATVPLDYAALGPRIAEQLWTVPQLVGWLDDSRLRKLLWCPRAGQLSFTCIDAADAIGDALREFGGVVCASATFGPPAEFAQACGLTEPSPVHVVAHTPWRSGAYDVAVDARVDTTFQQRARHVPTTAATVAALHDAARTIPGGDNVSRCVAVFFPSYAYAENVAREVERATPLRVALQPRLHQLAAQTAWVEEALALSDAMFLVLGSSFAESIDLLGGRIAYAMVVGPALPEVNAVQRARLAEYAPLGRAAAIRRVYQIPGMTKVNQALGRLVRAPGHRTRVLLHCRRFLEADYARLLATDYQFGTNILDQADFSKWLGERPAAATR